MYPQQWIDVTGLHGRFAYVQIADPDGRGPAGADAPGTARRLLTPVIPVAVMATLAALAVGALGGCGGQSGALPTSGGQGSQSQASILAARRAARREATRRAAARRAASRPVVTPLNQATSSWQPVARIAGKVAAWQAQRGGVTLLRFDQQLVRLALHAGLGEPEGSWTYGDRIGPREIHRVVAAVNGGFKFETGVIGFMADGRVAVALRPGLASIVTYRNGTTQIGAWEGGVPARGQPIASVLQNLHLLVDHGAAAGSSESCVQECWGSTLGGGTLIARSALGIAGDGQLVWAAGEKLSPAAIAQALVGAGVQRAVELDINPEWVAGYLYAHGRRGPSAEPVVAGQNGIPGRFLEPYSRDFFTILAR
jgi:hypothetical protein